MKGRISGKHGSPLHEFELDYLHTHLIQKRTESLQQSESLSFHHELPTKQLPLFFHSPFLLPDMERAVTILKKHIESGNRILLYGDRDSDGVSSTAILSHFLRSRYRNADINSITSTKDDAYGLCDTAMKRIRNLKPNLLITLDFGTSHIREIDILRSEGIEVIVLDHHEIPSTTPECALVNPKREDSRYPDKKICTAFLALKMVVAYLFQESDQHGKLITINYPDAKKIFFQNGIEIQENSLDKYSQVPVQLLSIQDLPGYEEIPLANRVFYWQISKIPELLKTQYEYSGLAGIGTITDMMPLIGENRSLVSLSCHFLGYSLQGKIEGTPGLNHILKNLKLRPEKVTSKDLGWGIGPLLNAAGRMGRTELAFDLLLTEKEEIARSKTIELIQTNEERKERTKRNIHKVNLFFQRHPAKLEKPILFCYEPDLEPGVSGIVATRLVETYGKPAIFITPDHGMARGSIRSSGSENVLDLLRTAEDILEQFGGHPEAGGFSVAIDKIPELERRFLETSIQWLQGYDFAPKEILSDLVCKPEDLKMKLHERLEKLEPTGQGNPPVIISLKDVQPVHFNFMGDGKHARFRVMNAGSLKFVIWNEAQALSKYLSLNTKISIWGQLEENHFNGKTSLQFLVHHYE